MSVTADAEGNDDFGKTIARTALFRQKPLNMYTGEARR
jgi:hypothetical protein